MKKIKINKKRRVISLLLVILMFIVEGVFLYLLYNKYSGINYIKAGVTFKSILPYEIAIFAFLIVETVFDFYTPYRKHYIIINRCFIIYLIVVSYFISFKFISYGSFFNGIIFIIYNNYLKSDYDKNNKK